MITPQYELFLPYGKKSGVAPETDDDIPEREEVRMQIRTAQEFGTAIRAERARRRFSQEQVAAAAGVGARFVVDLEGGKPTAQLDKALAVANAVGLSLILSSDALDD